jgi:hypothetical protein
MIQIVENGLNIRMITTKYATHAIDIAKDLRQVEELMENDRLVRLYERI